MKTSRTMRIAVIVAVLFLCCPMTWVTGSAIPMWEFLSRDEKMSYLYRVFSKQVARFCVGSSRPDCNKNLLLTGRQNLAGMDDNILDQLDPYQHAGPETIWRALVGTNRFYSRIGYDVENSYYTTGADSPATSDSDTNGIADEFATTNDYVRPSLEHSGPYLVGPLVIRVYPDGRPVPEDSARPLPKDEDAEEFKYSRLPSIEEIQSDKSETFYNPIVTRPSFGRKNQRRMVVTLRRNPSLPYERRVLSPIPLNERSYY